MLALTRAQWGTSYYAFLMVLRVSVLFCVISTRLLPYDVGCCSVCVHSAVTLRLTLALYYTYTALSN